MFAYCGSNPISFADPFGDSPWTIVAIIVACVIIIAADHMLAAHQPEGGYALVKEEKENGATKTGLYAEGNGFEVNSNGITICDMRVGLISCTIEGQYGTVEILDCLTAKAEASLDWSGTPSLEASAVASIYSPSMEVVVPFGAFNCTFFAEAYVGGVGVGVEFDPESGKFKVTPPFAGIGGTFSIDLDLAN